MNRSELEAEVVSRAAKDPQFRADLTANPGKTIESVLGTPLPEGVEICVLEETPTRFYLVLPIASAELTDDQLDGVAGGAGGAGYMRISGDLHKDRPSLSSIAFPDRS